ncbi:hypothetical protein [Rubellimicrobium aerolatum]|uniref:Uncharacterized protein n=1 Tax=Rubellimicrobium aerolatum TaxID=490979 RepID=A0ABW0SD58_9RHOB|nr:hypothetical protein [Rubellimicrobium aerolatum]MBP1806741.1 hypothetical protein [Rubellimicrobium aerolatum]
MTEIPDILTFRARRIALDLLTAYQRQRDAMRIAGVPSSELAEGDDGETVVADVAACMTVAARLPRAGLTPAVLERMRTAEEAAFTVLRRAAEAYFASGELRRELGRPAVEPFLHLRRAMSQAA